MKRRIGKIAATILVLMLGAGAATRAQAPTFTVLHGFTGPPDGNNPVAGPLLDAAGNLYGTTIRGGTLAGDGGIVFKIDPFGNETVLANFVIGLGPWDPRGTLIKDAAGNLYGTSPEGPDGGAFNFGTVFKLDTSGKVTVLHSFTCFDGAGPQGGLIRDAAGNLYGTAASALACGVFGTVFKIDGAGNFTVLHFFTGADGCCPTGGLIRDAAGNLYGTAGGGGAFGNGTVFRLDTFNNMTVLHNFKGTDGMSPVGGLIRDAAGNLYGTTVTGGTGTSSICSSQTGVPGCGTVFKLDPFGNESVLYSFKGGSDGSLPDADLVMDSAGNLYGTTSEGGSSSCTGRNQVVVGCGTVFKLDPAGNETILHSFTGGSDGATPGGTNPGGTLVMDEAGNLYGTAFVGGVASGGCLFGTCGTVFKITVQAPPTISSISPTSAIAGGPAFTLTVNGTNFVSGSTVNVNGNGRTTTFVSTTQVTAVILASDIGVAGSFNVTVTNPGGGTSNAVSFTVVTPEDATQTIINSVNTLFSQGVINAGQDNSLVVQLQHAITMMNAGKNAGAIGNLDSFITEVNDLLASDVLSPAQAAYLVSAAESVRAALS